MKPGTPALRSNRLFDQVREGIRYFHYSLQTEKSYLYGVRFSSHGMSVRVMRHLRDMSVAEVQTRLNMLSTE